MLNNTHVASTPSGCKQAGTFLAAMLTEERGRRAPATAVDRVCVHVAEKLLLTDEATGAAGTKALPVLASAAIVAPTRARCSHFMMLSAAQTHQHCTCGSQGCSNGKTAFEFRAFVYALCAMTVLSE
jgi:hypothetical protein